VPKKLEAISIEANSSFSYSIFIIEIALYLKGSSGWNLCNQSMVTSKLSGTGANSY